MSSAGAIVERELLRGSRRAWTYAIRAAFAGVLFAAVTSTYRDALAWRDLAEPGALTALGRELYTFYVQAQFWLLGLVTPILVAQGIVEEKSQGTLELLTISRLSARQVLHGKLLASLSRVASLMIAGLPVLALTLSLGGVAPGEILAQFACSVVVVVVSAAFAGYFALFARNPITPALLTWMWLFVAWFFGATPGVYVLDDDEGFGWTSVAYAIFEGIDDGMGAWALLPCAVWLFVAFVVLGLAERVFGSLVASRDGEDPDGALLSAEVWGLERIRRRTVLGLLLLALSSPGLILAEWLVSNASWTRLAIAFGLLWNVGLLLVGTLGFLFVMRGLLSWLARRRPRGVGWRRALALAEEDDAHDALLTTLTSVRPVRGAGMAHEEVRVRRRKPRALPWQREVWGNPVAWRETVTRAHGWMATAMGRLYIVAFLLLAGAAMREETWNETRPQELLALAAAGLVASCAVALFGATVSMTGEQQRGTLALLCVSPLGASRIVLGKFLGVVILAGPLFAVSALVLLGATLAFVPEVRYSSFGFDRFGELPDTELLAARWFANLMLAGVAFSFVTVAALHFGARARTAGRAWLMNLGLGIALAFGPALLLAVGRNVTWVEEAVALFNPVLQDDFWSGLATPDWFWTSVLGWCLLTGLLWWRTVRTLAERAR